MQNPYKSVKADLILAISVSMEDVGSAVVVSMQSDFIKICGDMKKVRRSQYLLIGLIFEEAYRAVRAK